MNSADKGAEVPAQVTAVIPTFRRPQLVERAARSVLAQTYPHLRVYVYDNASGDETPRVLARLAREDPRLSYVTHPQNIGPIPNFAHGVGQVRTPFFSVLSDDDFLLPEFYNDAISALSNAPAAGLFVGNALIRDEMKQVIHPTSRRMTASGFYEPPIGLLRLLTEDTLRLWTGVVFRSEAVQHAGGVDPSLPSQHDHDLVVRVAARYPAIISDKPSAMFVRHAKASHITDSFDDTFWPGWFAIIDKIVSDETLSPPLRKTATRALARKVDADLWRAAINALAQGRSEESMRLLTMVERRRPTLAGRMALTTMRSPLLSTLLQRTCTTALRLRHLARAAEAPRFAPDDPKFHLDGILK
jgi:glycosyltransferase involved in cell wall biosynthesis